MAPAFDSSASISRVSVWRNSGASLRRTSRSTAAPGVTFGRTSFRKRSRNSSTSHSTSIVSSITGAGAVIALLVTVTLASPRAARACSARKVSRVGSAVSMNSVASNEVSFLPFKSASTASNSRSACDACPAADLPPRKRPTSVRTSENDGAPRVLSQTYGTRRARYWLAASVPAGSAPATTVAVTLPKAFGTTCTTPSPGSRPAKCVRPIFSRSLTNLLSRPTKIDGPSRCGSGTSLSIFAIGSVTPVVSRPSRAAMCDAPSASAAPPITMLASVRSGIRSV